MKNKLSRTWLYIIIVFVFLLGAAVLFYPAISNVWAKHHQMRQIQDYNAQVEDMDEEDVSAELAAAEAYNKELLQSDVVLTDPFDAAAAHMKDNEYESLLATADVMAYIEIPVIKVYLPIYHGTSEHTLTEGVGHLEGTSLPVGGTGTHAVLSAHSGLPGAELFTDLEKVQIGNIFYLHVLGKTLVYQVDQIRVVLPSNTDDLKINRNEDYVTLVTCTPYGVNSHRLLVRGIRIYPETMSDEEQQQIAGEQSSNGLTTVEIVQYIAFSLAALLFLFLLSFFLFTVRKKRRSEGENDDKT